MASINVKVHPVVLFNIVSAYERRSPDAIRVIGTLLGSSDKTGTVEVTNSFVVQHREGNNEVAIDIEVAKDLYELHRKVNANEIIIGWFAAGGGEVNEYSVVIHDYYTRETTQPIHMTINPTKTGVSLKAYTSTSFGVPNKLLGTMFSPIQSVSIVAGYETEMVGLKACLAASGIPDNNQVSFESELAMLVAWAQKCRDIIATIIKYIDDNIITAGKPIPTNSNDIGRQLMSMVESIVPLTDSDNNLNTNLKDLMMVVYLSNLAKTQLMLNEKLGLL